MELTIIIVNWNSGALLRRCLDALAAACRSTVDQGSGTRDITYEVFVVDNASTDGSVAQARGSAPPFHLIVLPANEGFARANNLALRKATGEVLLLLNPDTEPRPGSLVRLVEFFTTHPSAGIVGGKLLNANGSVQSSVRQFPTLTVLTLLLTRLARIFPNAPLLRRYERRDFSYTRDARVDQVMGACFAIRRETLHAIGLLDEGFWIWFEEVDYCRRAFLAGLQTWFTPTVEVVHHRAVSFRLVSPLWRSWQFSRSACRYARKHLGLLPAGVVVLLIPVSLLTAVPAALLRSRPGVLESS